MTERNDPQELSREVLESFAQATGATRNERQDTDEVEEYRLKDPPVTIALDSRKEEQMIEIMPSDPLGHWQYHTRGPASNWKVDQTTDGGNLLTTLYYESDECGLICDLAVWGPPAKSTPWGIEIDNEDVDGDIQSDIVFS